MVAINEIMTGRVQQKPTREPLCDTVGMVAATAYQQLQFFTIPIGQNMGAAPFNFAKTKSHTNMSQAGQSGRGVDSIIMGIQLKVFGPVTGLPSANTAGDFATVADMYGLFTMAHLEFGIGKTELITPLDTIPGGVQVTGGGTVTDVVTNGMGAAKEYFSLRIPFTKLGGKLGGFMYYEGQANLRCIIHWDPAFTPSESILLKCQLVGIRMRPL